MIPIPNAVLAAIKSGRFRMTSSAEIHAGGTVIPAVVEDGTVIVDRTAAIRRTLRCTLRPDVGVLPLTPSDPLTPFGSELWVYTTLSTPDGATSVKIQQGAFPISSVTVDDSGPDIALGVVTSDRSWAISRRKILNPYTLSPTNITGAIITLINFAYSGLTYNVTTSSAQTATLAFSEGSDPWANALTLAQASGFELFIDNTGVVVGRPIPDPTTQPAVWDFTEGTNSQPVAVSRVYQADQVSNHFIVSTTSSNVSPPVRGEASDASVASPTYTGGPFGDIPTFSSSTVVTTVADAQNAAANLLAASLGLAESVQITTLPLPMIDVDDVVTLTRARIGLDGDRFVVDHAEHSLRPDGQTKLTLRRVTS